MVVVLLVVPTDGRESGGDGRACVVSYGVWSYVFGRSCGSGIPLPTHLGAPEPNGLDLRSSDQVDVINPGQLRLSVPLTRKLMCLHIRVARVLRPDVLLVSHHGTVDMVQVVSCAIG